MHSLTYSQYRMVAKAAIDLLLVFVNYSEPSDANGSLLGVDSPSRMDSPDSLPPNALLFKDAVEIVSEDTGMNLRLTQM